MMGKVTAWIAALLYVFTLSTSAAFADTSETAEFNFLFLKATENYNETVNIESLSLTKDEISNYLSDIFAKENVWYLETKYTPIDADSDGIIEEIRLCYRIPQSEFAEREALIESKIDYITALTEGHSNPDKIRIVYDYFIENYSYDETLMNNDICRLFETEQGTCAALSLGFNTIMERLNIPCEIVVGNDDSHEWVKIYVDNVWKNIDITKGLVFKDTNFPNAAYRAFLQSDSVLRAWGYEF